MANTTYSVAVKTVDGFQVYYIQQDEKAVAEIVPALGNNCYAFKVADGDILVEFDRRTARPRYTRRTPNRLRQSNPVPVPEPNPKRHVAV